MNEVNQHILIQFLQLTRLKIIPILLILKEIFLIMMRKKAQDLDNFLKLSLYIWEIVLVSFPLQNSLDGWSDCLKHE